MPKRKYHGSPVSFNSLDSSMRGRYQRAARDLAYSGGRYVLRNHVAPWVQGRMREWGQRAVNTLRARASSKGSTAPRTVAPIATSSKRFRAGGRGRVRVYGPGAVGRKFPKKVFKKANRFIKEGVVRKRETGAVISSQDCVYIGHNAIAMDEMWRAICYAVTRWFAKKAGQDFISIDSPVSGLTTADPNLTWRIQYKLLPDEPIRNALQGSGAAIVWGALGDALYNLILTTISGDYYELLEVELYSPDTLASTREFPYISVQAKQFMITVGGNSNMILQNTTLASVADTDGDMEENVTNNPLQGKMYTGVGQNFPLAFQNVVTGPTINLSPKTNPNSGIIDFDYAPAGNMSAAMRNLLNKPPPHWSFHGMKGSRYVKLAPGEIRRSNVKKFITMDLNRLITQSLPYLQPGASTSNMRFFGNVVFFGLERMLDSRSDEAPLRLAYEVTVTTSAVASYRPSLKFMPQVIVS